MEVIKLQMQTCVGLQRSHEPWLGRMAGGGSSETLARSASGCLVRAASARLMLTKGGRRAGPPLESLRKAEGYVYIAWQPGYVLFSFRRRKSRPRQCTLIQSQTLPKR